MLRIIHDVSHGIQSSSRLKGIPSIGAYLYDRIASIIMRAIHRYLAELISGVYGYRGVVLDIGCGTGLLVVDFVKKGFNYAIGLDLSSTMCKLARRRAIVSKVYSYIDIVEADAHRLPFRNNCIDIASAIGLVHHLSNPSQLFLEIHRILKNRGIATIIELVSNASLSDVDKARKVFHIHQVPRVALYIAKTLHGLSREESLGINYSNLQKIFKKVVRISLNILTIDLAIK